MRLAFRLSVDLDKKTVECRLVAIDGQIARVCSEREWEASRNEQREPDAQAGR